MDIVYLTAPQVWSKISAYKADYYDSLSAMYSGAHDALEATAECDTFWYRKNHKCRIHVPIAADIVSTSADLLFSNAPQIVVSHGVGGDTEKEQQDRLEELKKKNNIFSMLNEAAETAAALGDAFIKIRWDKNSCDFPMIDSVQPDCAWPEYRLGKLVAIHFFASVIEDDKNGKIIRAYERYTKGKIEYELYAGNKFELGTKCENSELAEFGLEPEVICPVDELLAVHIQNILPNRRWPTSRHGRSDLDGLRDMCDALDETYSSWVRDVRLGKARTIVPVDYLRRKPEACLAGCETSGRWEFDEDVETFVALDIDIDRAGGGPITMNQFSIRADDHAKTCIQLTQDILTHAGYSPQTFGLNISGSAQSGTALSIREKKTIATRDKKQNYWKAPLEDIMTSLVHVDAALYPKAGSHADDVVSVAFSDSLGTDVSVVANTVEMLNRAQALSVEAAVTMLYPDWSEKQKAQEINRIRERYAIGLESPLGFDAALGDIESAANEE